jgi:hypothetical protein
MFRVIKGFARFREPVLAAPRNPSMRGVGTKMGTVDWGEPFSLRQTAMGTLVEIFAGQFHALRVEPTRPHAYR